MHSTIIISYFKAHKREVLYMYVLWDMASWSRIPNSTNKGALWSKFVNTDKKRLNCKRVGNEIAKELATYKDASTIYGFLARMIIFFWVRNNFLYKNSRELCIRMKNNKCANLPNEWEGLIS